MGALGAVPGIFGALWWELLAKLGRKRPRDHRSWGQDGGKLRQSRAEDSEKEPSIVKVAIRVETTDADMAILELSLGFRKYFRRKLSPRLGQMGQIQQNLLILR